jgi:acid phosphatase
MAGTTQGVPLDFSVDLDEPHLGDLLEAKGRNWHVYAESYPGRCFQGSRSGPYARKHNPMISFVNINKDPRRCAKITDTTGFAADFAAGKLADFNLVVPNMSNDGHDTNAAYADKWFEKTFSPLLTNAAGMRGVMVVATFDEDDNSHGNHIYTAMVGPDVPQGVQNPNTYNHYGLLRTFELLWGLGTLGQSDVHAVPITGYYR